MIQVNLIKILIFINFITILCGLNFYKIYLETIDRIEKIQNDNIIGLLKERENNLEIINELRSNIETNNNHLIDVSIYQPYIPVICVFVGIFMCFGVYQILPNFYWYNKFMVYSIGIFKSYGFFLVKKSEYFIDEQFEFKVDSVEHKISSIMLRNINTNNNYIKLEDFILYVNDGFINNGVSTQLCNIRAIENVSEALTQPRILENVNNLISNDNTFKAIEILNGGFF